jgi:hypothetical protein
VLAVSPRVGRPLERDSNLLSVSYSPPYRNDRRRRGEPEKGGTQLELDSIIGARPSPSVQLPGCSRGQWTIRAESSSRPNKPNAPARRVRRTKPPFSFVCLRSPWLLSPPSRPSEPGPLGLPERSHRSGSSVFDRLGSEPRPERRTNPTLSRLPKRTQSQSNAPLAPNEPTVGLAGRPRETRSGPPPRPPRRSRVNAPDARPGGSPGRGVACVRGTQLR